jgi:hypothetical protein
MRSFGNIVLLPLLIATAACGRDPFALEWIASADTVRLYAISRPEPNIETGFDFGARRTVRIEAPATTTSWDLAVDFEDGRAVFLTPGFFGVDSDAALVELPDENFDDIEEAPEDDDVYIENQAIPVNLESLYVVRTRRLRSNYGQLCNHYAKMVPLDMDPDERTVVFVFDTNGICNSRKMQPDVFP